MKTITITIMMDIKIPKLIPALKMPEMKLHELRNTDMNMPARKEFTTDFFI